MPQSVWTNFGVRISVLAIWDSVPSTRCRLCSLISVHVLLRLVTRRIRQKCRDGRGGAEEGLIRCDSRPSLILCHLTAKLIPFTHLILTPPLTPSLIRCGVTVNAVTQRAVHASPRMVKLMAGEEGIAQRIDMPTTRISRPSSVPSETTYWAAARSEQVTGRADCDQSCVRSIVCR